MACKLHIINVKREGGGGGREPIDRFASLPLHPSLVQMAGRRKMDVSHTVHMMSAALLENCTFQLNWHFIWLLADS